MRRTSWLVGRLQTRRSFRGTTRVARCAALWLALASLMAAGQATGDTGQRDPLGPPELASMRKFLTGDPASVRTARWTPFLVALSRNAAIQRNLDDAIIGAAKIDPREAQALFNTSVVNVVADGLRRVGDEDLLTVRPLIARFLTGPIPCEDDTSQAPVLAGPMMLGDIDHLADVLTRAVVAVNAHAPGSTVDRAALVEATGRSMDRLDASERAAALRGLRAKAPVLDCTVRAVLAKVAFDSEPGDAPVLLRARLDAYVTARSTPKVYTAGEALDYPAAGRVALVHGSQRVRFTVRASGELADVAFVESRFEPDTVPLPDGTIVRSSELFDNEVRSWLRSGVAKYRPRIEDGVAQDTTFDIPFVWAM